MSMHIYMTETFVTVECILVSMAMEYNMQGIWHHTNSELNDVHNIMLAITCTHILQLLHCLILACSQLIFDAPSHIIIHLKTVRLEC